MILISLITHIYYRCNCEVCSMEVPILSPNLLAGDFCNLGGNDMSRDISDGERLTISGNIRLPYGILGSLTKVTE